MITCRELKDKQNNPRLHSAMQQLSFTLMLGIQEMKEKNADSQWMQRGIQINLIIASFDTFSEVYDASVKIARQIVKEISELCNGSFNVEFSTKVRDIYYSLKLPGKVVFFIVRAHLLQIKIVNWQIAALRSCQTE